jgi:hypothetical protein
MPTNKEKKPLTEEEKTKHIKKIQEEVEKHKKSIKKGDTFTSPTEEQLREKLGRVNSPMIISQGWGGAAPGGTVSYSVGVYNPDPTTKIWLFCHVFVGSGNCVSDTGMFLLNVDPRFPRLTQIPPTGFSLNPGQTQVIGFSIKIPSTIEPSGYIGNTALFTVNWHDIGTYLDRAVFVFQIT